MFNRHHTSSVRHRHRRGDPGSPTGSPTGSPPRIFLARDWIHFHDDEAPSAPLRRTMVGLSPKARPPTLCAIAPVPEGEPRPTFSVMLPTYEPDHRLGRSLAAVLAQAPEPAAMQIAVVDDGSRQVDVRALVRSFDPAGRVEVHLNQRRAGLAGNWNRCLSLARGRLVHLLHQDDHVLPGFYDRIGHAFRAAPTIGMAFCRSQIVDGDDRLIKTASRQQWTAGVLSGWLSRIAERQRVQTPAAVVARSTYERIGGFRADLCHALDWEMWVRIAAATPVWYDPRVLAVYRRHRDNESHRLLKSGAVWPDLLQAIELNSSLLPAVNRERVRERSARWYTGSALRTVEKQLARGDLDAAGRTLDHLPEMLRLLPGGGDRSAPLRRVGRLQDRLRTARRRAA